jgi:hypothetical protein
MKLLTLQSLSKSNMESYIAVSHSYPFRSVFEVSCGMYHVWHDGISLCGYCGDDSPNGFAVTVRSILSYDWKGHQRTQFAATHLKSQLLE